MAGARRRTPSSAQPASQQAAGGAQQPEHAGLRQELAHQAAAAGAQGGAHRHLSLAMGGARQQHVRDVGTGDQEQEGQRARHHEQRPPHVAHELLVQRQHVRGPAAVRVGVGRGRAAPAIAFISWCASATRHARAAPGQHHHAVRAAAGRPRIPLQRRPELALRPQRAFVAGKAEARRHHAHDLVRLVVHAQRASHHGGVGAEALPPQPVREHDHPRARRGRRRGRRRRPSPASIPSTSKTPGVTRCPGSRSGSPSPVRLNSSREEAAHRLERAAPGPASPRSSAATPGYGPCRPVRSHTTTSRSVLG